MLINLERAHAIMRENNVDVLIATHPRNVTYFSDFPQMHECTMTSIAFGVLPADPDVKPFVVVRAGSLPFLTQEGCWVQEAEIYAKPFWVHMDESIDVRQISAEERVLYEACKGAKIPSRAIEALQNGLRKRGLLRGRIGVDEVGLGQPRNWAEFVEGLAPAKVLPAAAMINRIRLVKTPTEVAIMEEAVRVNEAGFARCVEAIQEGAMETEAAAVYRIEVTRKNGTPHYANVGYGGRSALPTNYPKAVKPRTGDIVRLDFDCVYKNYFSDIGRTGVMREGSSRVKQYYSAVLTAVEEVKAHLKPGVKVSTLFGIGKETVQRAGIPYYTTNYIGHSIGMWCYDGLAIVPMEDRCVEEGMVLNLEPSHYELGLGVLHAEDTVLVTGTGCRSLQHIGFHLYQM